MYTDENNGGIEVEWSDNGSGSGSGSDWGKSPSPTYSELWADEEEKDEVTEEVKHCIQRVDVAHDALKASLANEPPQRVKIGRLAGRWDLYNLEVCPKTWDETDERYHLDFSQAAADRKVLHQDRSKSMWNQSFISWDIEMGTGDIVPFQILEYASLEPISIVMFRTGDELIDISADVTFLGNDCLRLRVPRSAVYPDKAGVSSEPDSVIEFAGLRQTEEYWEKRWQAEKEAELARKNAPSPPLPKWYDSDNGCPSEYEFQFYWTSKRQKEARVTITRIRRIRGLL